MMLKLKGPVALVFVCLLLSAAVTSTRAAIITVDATADSSIREDEPDAVRGNSTILRIEGTIGKTQYGFVHWDVSAIPPDATVDDATFVAIQTDTFVGPGLLVHSIDQGDWDEATTTWNSWVNQSTVVTELGLMPVNGSETDGGRSSFSTASLAALVQGWVDGSHDNRGILLTFNGTTTGDTLAAREHGTFDPPRLTIDYTPVPEPATVVLLGMGILACILARRVPLVARPPVAKAPPNTGAARCHWWLAHQWQEPHQALAPGTTRSIVGHQH